jgi:predicted ATPase
MPVVTDNEFIHTYIYIYIFMCVCAFLSAGVHKHSKNLGANSKSRHQEVDMKYLHYWGSKNIRHNYKGLVAKRADTWNLCTPAHTHIYICVCVCVCVRVRARAH